MKQMACAVLATVAIQAAAADFPPPGWPVDNQQALTGTWVGMGKVAGMDEPVWCIAPTDPMRLECSWNFGPGVTGTETGILYRLGAGQYNWARYGDNEAECDLFVLSGGRTLSGTVVEDRCSEPHKVQSLTIYRVSKEQNANLAAPTAWILNQWR